MASRKTASHLPQTPGQVPTRTPARTPVRGLISAARGAQKPEPKGQPLTHQIQDVLLQLQQVQSAVMVAVAALRSQACDLDEDIARVLQRAVAERLNEQMDLLEAVLARGKP